MTLLNINMCVDIVEHLPAMKLLASECDVIVEYGVREGTSTGAWLSQKPKKLTCIDLRPDVLVESGGNYRAFAEENEIDFQVICGNSMAVEPIPCDLLFIDTHHIYEQLIQELRRHGSSARKYIVCHDTTYNAGCWDAVVEYVNNHPEWTVKAHYENNNGLAVLERTGPMSATAKRIQAWYDEKMGPQALVMFEHFDTLIKYGKMVDRITEFGVHAGASTCCWLMSKPKSYTGYDIDLGNLTLRPLYEAYAKENGTDFKLICQSSIKEHIEETDLLFIDSDHRPEHVTEELRMQNDRVKRFIILHDTECADCPGLREVVDRFVAGSPDWKIREHYKNNCGLTVLERIGAEAVLENTGNCTEKGRKNMKTGIVIHSAIYGIGAGREKDVTGVVAELVAAGSVSVAASNGNFGDPAPGLVKRLNVKYSVDSVNHNETVGENETITFIPTDHDEE